MPQTQITSDFVIAELREAEHDLEQLSRRFARISNDPLISAESAANMIGLFEQFVAMGKVVCELRVALELLNALAVGKD